MTTNNFFPKQPGFVQGLLVILAYGLLAFFIAPVLVLLNKISPAMQSWSNFIGFVLSFGLLLPIAFWIFNDKKIEFSAIPIHFYFLLIPGTLALLLLVDSLVSLMPMPEKWQEFFSQAIQFNLPGFLSIGIAAPILEELIFRGIMLKGFLKKYPPITAITLSALLFGLAHMNPWQFIAAFLVGFLIGWLYWRTRSILPGLFIHFVNNSFSFYIGYAAQNTNITLQEYIQNNSLYICMLVFSFCLLGGLAIYFRHYYLESVHKVR